MRRYTWTARDRFRNRADDLAALERWWDDSTRDALALMGRRRVGKSWLFRRFAHGRPAVILVADQLLPATQMERFASQLEPLLGYRPDLPDTRALVEVLYRLGRDSKILAVVDELPYLLPEAHDSRLATLSAIQATMEAERDASQTKLVLCGSSISQMESLLDHSSPLHGRIRQLDVWPLDFAGATSMIDRPGDEDRILRYAVAGGMARYLAELGGDRDLETVVCERVLDRSAPLFDDPRTVLEQELRSPATYLSILQRLALGPAQTDHLTDSLRVSSSRLAPYLSTLEDMRLIAAERPVGAPADARNRRFSLTDGFVRFWFRFVFPHQDDLQSGLDPADLWEAEIEPNLADFVAPAYEQLCRRYARIARGATAPTVGGWWGRALDRHRRAGRRTSEEIDVAGAHRKRLRLAGECKWTASPMRSAVLDDLLDHKLPAIAQEKRLQVPADGPELLLFCRSGFEQSLAERAADDPRVELVDLRKLVGTLDRDARPPAPRAPS